MKTLVFVENNLMKKEFEIKGFNGTVDMSQPIIPGGSFTWGEMLHWKDFSYLDVRLPRTAKHSYNIINLAKAIQPIREKIGKPMIVTSGYRPDPYNRRAGGASRSQHKYGKAVDLNVRGLRDLGMNHRQLAKYIYEDLNFQGGVGGYSTWIHLDIGTRRKWGF